MERIKMGGEIEIPPPIVKGGKPYFLPFLAAGFLAGAAFLAAGFFFAAIFLAGAFLAGAFLAGINIPPFGPQLRKMRN
jgi:hypothetical protein